MSKFRFDLKAKKFRAEKERTLLMMANYAVNESKVRAFDTESWDGRKWPRRKNPKSKYNIGRRLLVKTGRMRSSIRIMKRGASSITYGTDVSYAKYHNEGTARLPKRQFIGLSRNMMRFNRQAIKNYLQTTNQRGKITLR